MGMFDYVQSEVPLPDGYTGKLQTKSFDSCLTTILIRADGRLLEKNDEYETVPVSERPFPNHPTKQFFGSRRLIKENWRELNFHGDFEFYGSERGTGAWHGYIARFTHGQLEYIKVAPARYGIPAREPSSGEGVGDNGLERGGSIAPIPEDTLTHLWPSGADQAQALREQGRKGGLRFEAYLPQKIADWLLDLIEREVFTDPSEAVFVILGEHMELQPHRDLRDELVRRRIQGAMDDPRPLLSSDEVRARPDERITSRSAPAVWTKLVP
jgi:hypothetical protein